MKKFLTVTFVLFILAAFIAVGVFWYVSLNVVTPADILNVSKGVATSTEAMEGDMATDESSPTPKVPTVSIPAGGILLSTLPLTDAQKNALGAVGIDSSTFVITESMLECGVGKIGGDRIEAMAKGQAPTFLETTKLIPCLGAN